MILATAMLWIVGITVVILFITIVAVVFGMTIALFLLTLI